MEIRTEQVTFVFTVVLMVWMVWGYWVLYRLNKMVGYIETYLKALENRFGNFKDVIEMESGEDDGEEEDIVDNLPEELMGG